MCDVNTSWHNIHFLPNLQLNEKTVVLKSRIKRVGQFINENLCLLINGIRQKWLMIKVECEFISDRIFRRRVDAVVNVEPNQFQVPSPVGSDLRLGNSGLISHKTPFKSFERAYIEVDRKRTRDEDLPLLIIQFLEVGLTKDEVITSLKNDHYSLKEINNGFDGLDRSNKKVECKQELPNPFYMPSNGEEGSVVIQKGPIKQHQNGSQLPVYVTAKSNLNQFKVGANQACTDICCQFIKGASQRESTPDDLSNLMYQNLNNPSYFTETFTTMQTHGLLMAGNPWPEQSVYDSYCLSVPFVDEHQVLGEVRSLEEAIKYIVNYSIGAIVIAHHMSIAIKKLDNGKIEIFDPHGDFAMHQMGRGAYVYRCSNDEQVVNFIRRKFPHPDHIFNKNLTSPVIQFWPVKNK